MEHAAQQLLRCVAEFAFTGIKRAAYGGADVDSFRYVPRRLPVGSALRAA